MKIELADRFDSGGHAKRELFEYIEPAPPAFDHRLRESGCVRATSASGLEKAATRMTFQITRVGAIEDSPH